MGMHEEMNSITNADKSGAFSLVISGFVVAFGALPLTCWFWLWTFAWRARLYLGRWPYYGNPDPKALPEHFLPQTEIYEYIIPLAASIILISIVTSLISKIANYRIRMLAASIVSIAGWATAFGLMLVDPGGFFEWIMD